MPARSRFEFIVMASSRPSTKLIPPPMSEASRHRAKVGGMRAGHEYNRPEDFTLIEHSILLVIISLIVGDVLLGDNNAMEQWPH
jgi:hypothetical protein